MTTIAALAGAGRSFGGRAVLSDVDLTVTAGEIVAVVGPNGGGKSTLLLLLSGLLRPTVGTATVCGIEAWRLSLASAGLVGLVTARPGLYPLLTGRENLRHFGGLFGLSDADVDRRSEVLLDALSFGPGFDERVAGWSTGMQQKLSLVRALLLSPKLLLLDEPTANLDPLVARTLHLEIRRRADEGLACVLVTHDLPSAEAIGDRALVVDGGIRDTLVLTERRVPEAGPLLAAWQGAVGPR